MSHQHTKKKRDEARNELAAAREELAQVRVQAAEMQAALQELVRDSVEVLDETGSCWTAASDGAWRRASAALAKAERRP